MEQKGLSKFAENAIAFGIAAAIIIGIIAAFGWTSVNAWVQEPLHWKEPEGVNIAFLSLNNGKKPKLNDLPLEIEKDASVVLFLHRGAHCCGVNSSDTEIIIGKNQYGYSGTIEATFDLERQVFLEKEL